ncbi:DUF1499 domain-containing protein [Pseudothioclava arenosa]|uniref:DUF1499 domain-containing protein n=1 Tax=Pseudothioclava arenosa TaxID=1795308 RepID=A0A2A4CNQ2_9RHOB|nr:DUF1499 domain-containing protein [Pseudothioclava arenosa]PCD75759.1 hypothetical protein CLN94_12710 [Pseudothioclava arenosa]
MRVVFYLILAGLFVAAQAYVRLAPLPAARLGAPPQAQAPGDWPARGGFAAARVVADPQAALAALVQVAEATPRTRRLSGSPEDGHLVYVTRTLFWGFPDITHLWVAGDTVQAQGHLVFGGSDFGVNRARLEGWLAQAGID